MATFLHPDAAFGDPADEPTHRLRHAAAPPPAATLEPSARQLLKLLLDDFRLRWSRGERTAPEHYLERYPHLATDPEFFDLIYENYLLHEQAGDAPDAETYAARFPHHADRLRQQVELHRLLGSLASHGHAPAPAPEAEKRGSGPAARADANPLWPAIPGYEILGELGRGGMGVVYRARQVGLNRVVALKMMLGGAFTDPEYRARFHSEAEAVARIQHAHVIQIFAIGIVDSPLGPQFAHPYFALEYKVWAEVVTGKALHEGTPRRLDEAEVAERRQRLTALSCAAVTAVPPVAVVGP